MYSPISEKHTKNSIAGATVKFNFASSGALATQIEQGAPVDVFASADVENVDRLQKKNFDCTIQQNGFRFEYAGCGSAGFKIKIRSLADLNSSKIIHLWHGDPSHVPAGKYARQSLKSASLECCFRQTGNGHRRSPGAHLRPEGRSGSRNCIRLRCPRKRRKNRLFSSCKYARAN